MTEQRLTKGCLCAACGEPMAAGDAFKWLRGHRSMVGGKVGGSYTIKTVATYRPCHMYDCRREQSLRDQRKRDIEAVDRECAIAAKYEDAAYVANYRARRYEELGLTGTVCAG